MKAFCLTVILLLLQLSPIGAITQDSLFKRDINNKVRILEAKYKSQNDSLLNEVKFYRVKEDYYTEALSFQTSLFLSVFGLIITIASVISYSFITKKIEAIKEDTERQINTISIKVNRAEKDISDSNFMAKIYASEARLRYSQSERYVISNTSKQNATKAAKESLVYFVDAHKDLKPANEKYINSIVLPCLDTIIEIYNEISSWSYTVNVTFIDPVDVDLESNAYTMMIGTRKQYSDLYDDWAFFLTDDEFERTFITVIDPATRDKYFHWKFQVQVFLKDIKWQNK